MAQSRTLYGIHPVIAVLRAGRCPVHRVLVARGRGGAGLDEVTVEAERCGVAVKSVSRDEIVKRTGGARAHQGVAAECGPYPYADLRDLLDPEGGGAPLILALDGVEDPQNLGALLRSAAALGATGAVLPRSRGAGVTAAVSKASAGAAELVPVVQASGMDEAIRRLKAEGCWILGAEADGTMDPLEAPWVQPCVLVLGGEGRGLRKIVRSRCDAVLRIDLPGPMSCLNVSAAGAILLFAASRAKIGPKAQEMT